MTLDVIRQKYEQTLVRLGLGHRIVVILLVYNRREKACDFQVTCHDVMRLEESRESLGLE